MEKSIIIAGVGGQGTLIAAKIIGAAAQAFGLDIKVSECHGMSQRGGSVITYAIFSDKKVHSPVVTANADIILAFEQLEAYRMLPFLKKGGTIVASTQQMNPMPVISGAMNYPENIPEKIKSLGVKIICADALNLALQAGNQKCANVVIIGALAAHLCEIPKEIWIDALKNSVPQKFLDENLKAFESGYAVK
ncbi:MAG: indolepyruvate oxidoreductase subunit beta [Defluviitaleaceae bacterium]|nr:indolepyruvate oxidoreductase subunit beta [Defluviitaleaceae bacterium]